MISEEDLPNYEWVIETFAKKNQSDIKQTPVKGSIDPVFVLNVCLAGTAAVALIAGITLLSLNLAAGVPVFGAGVCAAIVSGIGFYTAKPKNSSMDKDLQAEDVKSKNFS